MRGFVLGGNSQLSRYCDNADDTSENVQLSYSIDSGSTWVSWKSYTYNLYRVWQACMDANDLY